MISIRKTLLATALIVAGSLQALAAGPQVNATSTGLALRGIDPVSYFTDGGPVDGHYTITSVHDGAVYRFANKDNKAKFDADPQAYLPQYGGYCAFGTALGKKFDGDPHVYEIVDHKLYFNLAKEVAEKWHADQARYIADANAAWPTIEGKTPEQLE